MILVVAGAVFLLMLLQSLRCTESLQGTLAVAAGAVVARWFVPPLLAALIFTGFSQVAISAFMLHLLLAMIGSIRVLAGVIAAGVFVLVVRRGLGEMRGV